MDFYAWVTPAFVPGSPVDHTWVTSYDAAATPLPDIEAVVKAGENYWYSWGRFHETGDQIVLTPAHPASFCLVPPNDQRARGTIHWYGIHGVCHQVSNQALYPTRRTVSAARGYKASKAVYTEYGRPASAWNDARIACNVAPVAVMRVPQAEPVSPLRQWAVQTFGRRDDRPQTLEGLRGELLTDIDTIAFAPRIQNETRQDRAMALNRRIQEFFTEVGRVLDRNDRLYEDLLGIKLDAEINLIDPELFEIPPAA